MEQLKVVICGGGVAAIEGLLRLHRIAGERVDVTLVAPNEYLTYRPLTVLVPFDGSRVARYPLRDLTAATSARWLPNRAVSVEHRDRTVHLANGQSVHYDALLLAPGAKERKPNPHVAVFSDRTGGQSYGEIVEAITAGHLTNLALIEPSGPSWPLPLYELALLTAKHAHDRGVDLEIALITPNPHPLYPFGDKAAAAVQRLLQAADVALHLNVDATIAGPRLIQLGPPDRALHPDRIVTLPTITGPSLPGLPGDARDRFIPVDDRCRVRGTDGHVFAAGDATDLPVKHGSLAAQQADVAAAGIAHLAGAAPLPESFRPVLRGTLLTGDTPLYLEAQLIAGRGWKSEILSEPDWPSDQLVAAEELAAYLADHGPAN